MDFKTKLIIAFIITLLITIASLYVIVISKQYMITSVSVFITSLFAMIMVFFTFYNYATTSEIQTSYPIKLNTCPDYYYVDTITRDGKVEKVCKPFIFEGNDGNIMYMLKTIQPLATNITTIEQDLNNYDNINTGFYKIENIKNNEETVFDKFGKVLDVSNIDGSLNLNQLNNASINAYDKKSFNIAMCSCGTNLGWSELQHKCGKENLDRGDKDDACYSLSTYIHNENVNATSVYIDKAKLNSLNYQTFNTTSDKDSAQFINQHFIDPKAIQTNYAQ